MNNAVDSSPLDTKSHWFLSRGSLVAWQWPPVTHPVAQQRKFSFRYIPYPGQRIHSGWLADSFLCLADVMASTAQASVRPYWPLRLGATSPVRGVYLDHVWISIAVANAADARNVSCPYLHVRTPGRGRRAAGRGRIWRRLSALGRPHAAICTAFPRAQCAYSAPPTRQLVN